LNRVLVTAMESSVHAPDPVPGTREPRRAGAPPWLEAGRALAKDTLAGLVASVALIANIVSFGALMFPGDLSAGTPTAIWALLIGSCIGGVWIALTTSLPPLASGIDSPTGAVLVLLSATAGTRVLAAGGSTQAAVQTVMLIFSAATVLSGALLYGLGTLRLGSSLRFVPFFVVRGFMAATGWFLIAGSIRMATGDVVSIDSAVMLATASQAGKLAGAAAVLAVLLAVRRWVKSTVAMPVALLLMSGGGAIALRTLGIAGHGHGWFLPSLGALTPWSPLEAVRTSQLTWSTALAILPELLAVTIVALVSLVTKVSSIEVARKASGDLNCEFRGHGLASLIAAPFGGLISGVQIASSSLLVRAGAVTRFSGVACALALGVVGVASFDLPGLIPIPVVAGLIFYLGWTFIEAVLSRPRTQRAWLDLVLAVAIMAVCIRYGYVVGVLGGVVGACLLFAINYARIGAVRRHLTRAQFSSYVNRSPEASHYLIEHGEAVQIYWLAGYLFFGSSEGVFERIRGDITALPVGRVAYVILDFGMVSGADSSASVSLTKLNHYCEQQGVALICCALAPAVHSTLARGGTFGAKGQQDAFADRNLALAWCENQMLANAKIDTDAGLEGFEPWLQRQLGERIRSADLMAYLERKDVAASQVIYREGEPADNVDLVAAGSLAIDIAKGTGDTLRVRTVMAHTVVGEMGFFRRSVRSATVSADGPATLFTLTRANFERMRRERPDLAVEFDDFILREMADRVSVSDLAALVLSR
jgi:SulP family sulfate permease